MDNQAARRTHKRRDSLILPQINQGQGASGELEFRGNVLDAFTVVTVKSDELLPVSVQPFDFLRSTLVALNAAVAAVSAQFALP